MDAIKKKMEKLTNETAAAEARIETFERLKESNEAEAEKFEKTSELKAPWRQFLLPLDFHHCAESE